MSAIAELIDIYFSQFGYSNKEIKSENLNKIKKKILAEIGEVDDSESVKEVVKEKVVAELKEEPKPEVKEEPKPKPVATNGVLVQSAEGRLKCPKCGMVKRNMFREVQDTDHIIMDYPVMYGKKYICGKCGAHWRRDMGY